MVRHNRPFFGPWGRKGGTCTLSFRYDPGRSSYFSNSQGLPCDQLMAIVFVFLDLKISYFYVHCDDHPDVWKSFNCLLHQQEPVAIEFVRNLRVLQCLSPEVQIDYLEIFSFYYEKMVSYYYRVAQKSGFFDILGPENLFF
jgi:hypothetical protein